MRRKPRTLAQKIKRRVLLAVSFLIILLFFVTRSYFSETVRSYAINKAKLQMSILINEAVSKEVVPNINTENLFFFKTNDKGHVTNVVVDVYQINNVIAKMTADIQNKLQPRLLEENLQLPLGVIVNHPLFNNLGPKVNIKIKMVGSVNTDIVTRTVPYGINNSLMEVLIKTKITFLVMMPFYEEEVTMETFTPLVIKMIQGEVPQYYYNGNGGEFIYPPRNDN